VFRLPAPESHKDLCFTVPSPSFPWGLKLLVVPFLCGQLRVSLLVGCHYGSISVLACVMLLQSSLWHGKAFSMAGHLHFLLQFLEVQTQSVGKSLRYAEECRNLLACKW
jgi:hypothetical protein